MKRMNILAECIILKYGSSPHLLPLLAPTTSYLMKHLKNNTLRLGGVYGLLLILLDSSGFHSLFADTTWTLVHDIILLLSFIILSIYGINHIRKLKQPYSFKLGYFKALKIGGIGVVIYFILNLLINCFYIESGESISKLFGALLPNLLTQSGINLFLLIFFSLLPPAYFMIMGNSNGQVNSSHA